MDASCSDAFRKYLNKRPSALIILEVCQKVIVLTKRKLIQVRTCILETKRTNSKAYLIVLLSFTYRIIVTLA